jgi:hypothetical protein
VTQTTPTLALVKPGGGSTGLNTPPDRVDIDVLNGNADKIDAFAAGVGLPAARSTQFYGLAANIGSVTPKVGDEYQESDGNKLLWRFDGANWVSGVGGMWMIRPASVAGTGVTINTDGSVAAVATSAISINGVFSAKYRRYRIVADVVFGSDVGWSLLLRAGDVNNVGAGAYRYGIISSNGVTAESTSADFPLANAGGAYWTFGIEISNPADAAIRTGATWLANEMNTAGTSSRTFSGGGVHGGTEAFDGFHLQSGANGTGNIRIYGYA